jgi:hypothetical protein
LLRHDQGAFPLGLGDSVEGRHDVVIGQRERVGDRSPLEQGGRHGGGSDRDHAAPTPEPDLGDPVALERESKAKLVPVHRAGEAGLGVGRGDLPHPPGIPEMVHHGFGILEVHRDDYRDGSD